MIYQRGLNAYFLVYFYYSQLPAKLFGSFTAPTFIPGNLSNFSCKSIKFKVSCLFISNKNVLNGARISHKGMGILLELTYSLLTSISKGTLSEKGMNFSFSTAFALSSLLYKASNNGT